jgi:hypothetical protein
VERTTLKRYHGGRAVVEGTGHADILERNVSALRGLRNLFLFVQHGEELDYEFFVPEPQSCFVTHGDRSLVVAQRGLVGSSGAEGIVDVHNL